MGPIILILDDFYLFSIAEENGGIFVLVQPVRFCFAADRRAARSG
jgi:hypothetical protein